MSRVLTALGHVRTSMDAEAVHRLRVALRRCRSLAVLMEEVDPHPAWMEMRRRSRKLFRRLGVLRSSLTDDQFDAIHHLIRKGAHFAEYFIFCLLLYRGVRLGRVGWRWTWGVAALSCAAGYSVLDEIHQALVSSRTASAYDSLLDSIGAFAAFGVLWLWFRLRRSTVDEVPVSSAPSA